MREAKGSDRKTERLKKDRAFGKYVEEYKRKNGLAPNQNLSSAELNKVEKEFDERNLCRASSSKGGDDDASDFFSEILKTINKLDDLTKTKKAKQKIAKDITENIAKECKQRRYEMNIELVEKFVFIINEYNKKEFVQEKGLQMKLEFV